MRIFIIHESAHDNLEMLTFEALASETSSKTSFFVDFDNLKDRDGNYCTSLPVQDWDWQSQTADEYIEALQYYRDKQWANAEEHAVVDAYKSVNPNAVIMDGTIYFDDYADRHSSKNTPERILVRYAQELQEWQRQIICMVSGHPNRWISTVYIR